MRLIKLYLKTENSQSSSHSMVMQMLVDLVLLISPQALLLLSQLPLYKPSLKSPQRMYSSPVPPVTSSILSSPLSNVLCQGYNKMKQDYPNIKYAKHCQQHVIDYYNKVGWTFTDDGVKKAHNEAYFDILQRDQFMTSGIYDQTNDESLISC